MITPEEDASRKTAQRRLESELLILQSDKGKSERQQNDLMMEVKRLRNDAKRLEIVIQEKEAAELKLNREISLIETEITHLKKQMNAL